MSEQSPLPGDQVPGHTHYSGLTVNEHREINRGAGVAMLVIGLLIAIPSLVLAALCAAYGAVPLVFVLLIPMGIGFILTALGWASWKAKANKALASTQDTR